MNKRTDAELNRIIAEWRGWTTRSEGNVVYLRSPDGTEQWGFSVETAWEHAPNYCNDLNAIHEATIAWIEKDAPTRYRQSEREHLLDCQLINMNQGQVIQRSITFLGAHQRAEALVAVIEEGGR